MIIIFEIALLAAVIESSILNMKRKADKESNAKKVNFEELIMRNISKPKMALDYSGYQFTFLDLNVLLLTFRTKASRLCPRSLRTTNALKP